jgi:hypothetical protein
VVGTEPVTTILRRCSACGASVEVPATVRATTCAFCDSALVDAEADAAEPVDRVVPFAVDRGQAGERLSAFLAGRWFAPESIRRASAPDELNEVLVPFHVFDAVARTTFSVRIGLYWYRTETYTVTVNGKTETRTRQVKETEWFPLEGSHVRQWFDHLVSASRGLPEAHANALEPFDLGEAKAYSPSLLAGRVAERATVPKSEAASVARRELARLEQQVIEATHLPGDTHSGLTSSTGAELEEPRLVLLPVWIAVVQGPKGPLRLLVNGQSGEVVSDAIPTSWWKVGLVVALVLLVIGAVAAATLGGGLLLGLIGAVMG